MLSVSKTTKRTVESYGIRLTFARSVSHSALCEEVERTETIYSKLLSITADGWSTVGPVLAGNPVTDVTDGSRLETNDREY
jgi:hypothetical protein